MTDSPSAQRNPVGQVRADPSVFLGRLRAEFPAWGLLHDPFADIWWGLHHGVTLRACSGIALREQILTSRVAVTNASAPFAPTAERGKDARI